MNYIQYMKEPFQPIGFTVGVPTDKQASAGVLKIRLAGITSDKTPTKEELILLREELARSLAKKENNIVTETDRQNAEIDANVENAVTPRWLKGLKLAKNAANFGLGAGAFVGTTMAYPYFAAAGPGGLATAGGLQGTALGMMGNALENLYGFNAGLTTGSAVKDAMLGAAGEAVLGPMIGKGMNWVGNKIAPVWNAAKPYVKGLYNTTNYSSLGNRLAHPIESLRFAKINTKLSDLVRQAYPKETAEFMLEEASPLFKTVRYYNKGNSGPLYIGGTEVPLLIEGLRNTPTTTVKMWDRAHEYGHLFDDALRRLDVGMARGNFGLSKEGISLVPKNYNYSPGVGINTPRGQMEFMADNIASSLYPEPKHVGMLNGEVAPYLERLVLAAQVPFSSMYVLNGSTHVPYFLPEYKNFERFIPTSAQRGNLGKGQDRFITYLEEQTGQKLQRIPISHSKIGDIYTDGFSFINSSGEEIAHIAGSKYGKDIYVESSYIHPNFRQKGIGKLMYFDFNNHIFQNTGRTLHSSPYLHMSTVEIEPGSGVFISPSSKLWRGLKSRGLATLEGNGLNRYYVMRPPSSTIDAITFKSGGSIHIKKKNKGKFTDYCGGKVTEECIRKGKNSSNPTTRKRANFAWVARHKFKHEDGGNINYLNYFRA